MRSSRFLICAAWVAAAAAACSRTVVISIDVSPKTLALTTGSTGPMTASGTYSNGTVKDITSQVTWLSSNTPAATVGPHSGLVTAIKPGSVSISASGEGITSTAKITVTPPLSSLKVTGTSASVPAGVPNQFKATGIYTDASQLDLTSQVIWSSSDLTVAKPSTTTTGQILTLKAGAVTISAKDTISGVTGSTGLTVTSASLSSITVTAATSPGTAGVAVQFTATGHYSDSTSADITSVATWTAPTATVSNSTIGLITPTTSGTLTVTATVSGVSGQLAYSVNPAPVILNSITINGPSSTPLGVPVSFTATGHYSDGSSSALNSGITWGSSDTSKATFSGNQLTPVAAGSTNVTVTHGSTGVNAQVSFTVDPPALVSIAINAGSGTFTAASSNSITAMGTYTDGSQQDVTGSATWGSDAPTVADVSVPGTLLAGIPGSAQITATVGSVSGSTSVTVQ